MPVFNEFFSVFKECLPLIAAGGAIVSAAGLVRVGPGRAVWIALRSRFAFKPVPESLRSTEIKLLKTSLADRDFGQGYLVVMGEKGVGKTCLLNTVTSKTPGVIRMDVRPGDTENIIIKKTLQQLTRLHFDLIRPNDSAKRVIFWFRLLTLGRSPIVVIHADDRNVGQEYACLAGAVRTLVEDYKLRVVVDGSPNSLEQRLLRTKRQRVFDIKPMTREMYVKEAGLDDTVFAVLGGVPSRYEQLWGNSKIDLQAGRDAREVIGSHLCDQICASIKLVNEFCGNDDTVTAKLMKLFQETSIFTKSTLSKLQRPNPDEVFYEAELDGVHALIPASNAIGIVLRHSLTKEPTLDELEVLVRHKI